MRDCFGRTPYGNDAPARDEAILSKARIGVDQYCGSHPIPKRHGANINAATTRESNEGTNSPRDVNRKIYPHYLAGVKRRERWNDRNTVLLWSVRVSMNHGE